MDKIQRAQARSLIYEHMNLIRVNHLILVELTALSHQIEHQLSADIARLDIIRTDLAQMRQWLRDYEITVTTYQSHRDQMKEK